LNTIDEDASDHHKKEEYAFRFLLLFVPFRSKEDLETDECYQGALQRAHQKGRISEEMIQIAENIQTLHNSLASDIVENSLSVKNVLSEDSDFEITSEEDDDDNYENVLAGIGELYSTLTNVDGLKEDSISLDPKFGMSQDKEPLEAIQDLESVIEYSNSEDIRQGNP
jgi:hypothetical protein